MNFERSVIIQLITLLSSHYVFMPTVLRNRPPTYSQTGTERSKIQLQKLCSIFCHWPAQVWFACSSQMVPLVYSQVEIFSTYQQILSILRCLRCNWRVSYLLYLRSGRVLNNPKQKFEIHQPSTLSFIQ